MEIHSFTHSIARVLLIFIAWTTFSNTTQYAKKKKNWKKEQSRDLHDGIRDGSTHPDRNPARQGL